MEHILFSIENAVANITFNRPQVFNSMHHAMRMEILEALDICEKDVAVRAVYITGTGKAFCAGEDLQEVTDP
ncbi:MAG: enoyl-CoA hydratase/isomerase family protein, partial [Saprospiraceae bacterium]